MFNKKHTFLCNKNTGVPAQQEDMSSCSTQRHAFFFFLLNKKKCLPFEARTMSNGALELQSLSGLQIGHQSWNGLLPPIGYCSNPYSHRTQSFSMLHTEPMYGSPGPGPICHMQSLGTNKPHAGVPGPRSPGHDTRAHRAYS